MVHLINLRLCHKNMYGGVCKFLCHKSDLRSQIPWTFTKAQDPGPRGVLA